MRKKVFWVLKIIVLLWLFSIVAYYCPESPKGRMGGFFIVDIETGQATGLSPGGQVAGFDVKRKELFFVEGSTRLAKIPLDSKSHTAANIKILVPAAASSWMRRFCALSPDASKIAYVDSKESGIYVANTTGNDNGKCVVRPPNQKYEWEDGIHESYVLEWIGPDKLVVCYWLHSNATTPSIAVVDINTCKSDELYKLHDTVQFQGHFSVCPSRKEMAVFDQDVTPYKFFILDLTTGKCRNVFPAAGEAPKYVSCLTWSPDGSTLAYMDPKDRVILLDADTLAVRKTIPLKRHLFFNSFRQFFVENDRLSVEFSSEGRGDILDTYDTRSGKRISSARFSYSASWVPLTGLNAVAYGY